MIWSWSAKVRTNTSVALMYSGNGERGQLFLVAINFLFSMYLTFLRKELYISSLVIFSPFSSFFFFLLNFLDYFEWTNKVGT